MPILFVNSQLIFKIRMTDMRATDKDKLTTDSLVHLIIIAEIFIVMIISLIKTK